MQIQTPPILRLTPAEIGLAVLAFLEQYLEHGEDNPNLLRADLAVMYSAHDSPYTADPASWSDWLKGVWALRAISAGNRISTQSDVNVNLPNGRIVVARVRSFQPTNFGVLSDENELGNPAACVPLFSEVTGYELLVAYAGWSGFPVDLTVDDLIKNLRAIQAGTAGAVITNSWGELLA
jgi:hypothetical protein